MALFDLTIIFICIVDNILVAASGTSGQSFNSVGAFRLHSTLLTLFQKWSGQRNTELFGACEFW
eukprot:6492555-Amphidinium_carterae.3